MNYLFYGDNLEVMKTLPSDSVDLIYLDPPFNSNRNYSVIFNKHGEVDADVTAQIQAFEDTWHWTQITDRQFQDFITTAPSEAADAIIAAHTLLGKNDATAYLVNMAPRLVEMRRLMKDTATLWLHCDPTMSHYLKTLMDAIFGVTNFQNEVIWQRARAKGDATRKLGSNHDVILCYGKSAQAKFHPVYGPQSDTYKSRFTHNDNDGRGPYRHAPLDSPSPRPNLTYDYKGYSPPTKGWRVSREEMERLDADKRLAFPKKRTGRIARKHYLNEQRGPLVGDVWTDIGPLQGAAAERLGYPTQKPLALLERILQMATNEGDLVLDPFAGCGTTIDAAQALGRAWIGIDVTYIAVDLIKKRLVHTYGEQILNSITVLGIPKDLAGAQALFDKDPFEFERWAVTEINAQPNERQVGDKGIDGKIRFPTDTNGSKIKEALVSVKGGQYVSPSMVRDLAGTVHHTRNAEMGILITMDELTKGSQEVIDQSGSYTFPVNGQQFPRLQHLTVEEILQGKRPKMPSSLLPYIAAKRQQIKFEAPGLF